jgi:hypothetical protein
VDACRGDDAEDHNPDRHVVHDADAGQQWVS